MILRAFTLSQFGIRRLSRHRALVVTLVALPLVTGVARALFENAGLTASFMWSCPIAFALLSAGAIGAQRMADRATGLTEAIGSCPISSRAVAGSAFASWAVLVALQMAIFGAIIGLL